MAWPQHTTSVTTAIPIVGRTLDFCPIVRMRSFRSTLPFVGPPLPDPWVAVRSLWLDSAPDPSGDTFRPHQPHCRRNVPPRRPTSRQRRASPHHDTAAPSSKTRATALTPTNGRNPENEIGTALLVFRLPKKADAECNGSLSRLSKR